MKQRLCASFLGIILIVACNKKEPAAVAEKTVQSAARLSTDTGCAKEIITDKPVKAGETGIILPVGTKLCFTADNLEIRVTLPVGFTFITSGVSMEKALPVYGTYTCSCSENSHCQVFYAEGMGFGCLQSSCSGSCTGSFTYHGYSVNKVVSTTDKESFFSLPEVQKQIAAISSTGPYSKQSIFGVSFYLVNDEQLFLPKASCDCEGTAACKLKAISIPLLPKIYICEGSCNGCELTVN